ncbi:MAG: hypothetical protein RL223_4738 [Pseudomonadota bacterium]|jgi:carbonic anhydrase/acetyltransferase-like protein (isoleucine patch superfamily)
MSCYRLDALQPRCADDAWIAPGAHVIGDVHLKTGASIWFGAVLRGDNAPITLGERVNVQEGAVLHADPGFPLNLADEVTVGHQAMLHGCTVGAGSLIGIQAVILNGAVMGDECLVGAGALVTEGKVFPPRSLILGTPAKVVRPLTEAEVHGLRESARGYARKAQGMRRGLVRVD